MTSDQFIQKNKNKEISSIALLLSKKPELDKEYIINQINGIQKAKKKLPEFFNNKKITYPSILSMEQCSSEKTALYKSDLIQGKSIIDLTGGFGVDSYYFSKKYTQVTYVEPNTNLFNIASNNFKLLETKNINTINSSAEDFLNSTNLFVDVVYIDPSRRSLDKRVFNLSECDPDIINLSDQIFKISNQILIKTAPFLDLKQGIKELKHVHTVFVISVNNECKEVLYLLNNKSKSNIQVRTINLSKTVEQYNFDLSEESSSQINYSDPQQYIYEPNSSILKAGAFNSIGNNYKLSKIAPNSHLYTSKELIHTFPGRKFKIENTVRYNPKEFKKLNIRQANITCRNFIEKPEEVKRKLKLKDGGNNYIFATTNNNNQPILISCIKQ